MKKLMMMLTVACAASIASAAASISWRSGLSAWTIDGEAANGNAVILILADGASAPTLSWDSGLQVSGGKIIGYGNLGSDGKNTTAISSNLSAPWDSAGATYNVLNGTGTIAADFEKHNYYQIVFDSGSITDASKYQVSTVLADKRATKNTNALSLGFSGQALSSENWTNIPEPCTVALLALGMGALALRRKQR